MNHRAVPSIFVSVSIVGFFAVALYPRDGPPRNSRDQGGSLGATGRVGPGVRGDVTKVGAVVGRSREGAKPSPAAATPRREVEAPVPAIRAVSGRAERPRPATAGSTAADEPGRRLARAPFAVAGTGETITDIARRVYGTPDRAEALWRANRDVARGPGSTLAPGTLLHTPDLPRR